MPDHPWERNKRSSSHQIKAAALFACYLLVIIPILRLFSGFHLLQQMSEEGLWSFRVLYAVTTRIAAALAFLFCSCCWCAKRQHSLEAAGGTAVFHLSAPRVAPCWGGAGCPTATHPCRQGGTTPRWEGVTGSSTVPVKLWTGQEPSGTNVSSHLDCQTPPDLAFLPQSSRLLCYMAFCTPPNYPMLPSM